MEILKKNKPRLENDVTKTTTTKNPDSSSWIYLTTIKLGQCKMVAKNTKEK